MISVSRFFTGIENMETSGRLAFGMLIRFFLYRTNKICTGLHGLRMGYQDVGVFILFIIPV